MINNNPAEIYPRTLKSDIIPYLNKPEIIAIKGPRQVGKTTLMLDIYHDLEKDKKCKLLTFEDRRTLEIFNNDLSAFRTLYLQDAQVIFIDEFQYAHEGGQKLKLLYDTSDIKFIISGSSSLELTGKTGKYLVGRILSFYLYPFSFSEYLASQNASLSKLIADTRSQINSFLNRKISRLPSMATSPSSTVEQELTAHWYNYCVFGGYPRVVTSESDQERRTILNAILETYLLKDIKSLLELATDDKLINLGKALALQIGNLVEYRELGNIADLNFSNLKKHLNILKETYIIDLIKPYYKNKRTEISKNPKVYFIDLGLRNSLLDNFNHFSTRPDQGELAENYVFTQLSQIGKPINFWRSKSQAEVDFILESGDMLTPIEVKLHKRVIGKSLQSFIKKYQPQNALIVVPGQSEQKILDQTTITFLPGYYL